MAVPSTSVWKPLIDLPLSPSAPAQARQAIQQALTDLSLSDSVRDDVLIAVSEVVELIVRTIPHTPGQISLAIRLSESHIELELRAPLPVVLTALPQVSAGPPTFLPLQLRLIHGAVDLLTISLDGVAAIQLKKSRS